MGKALGSWGAAAGLLLLAIALTAALVASGGGHRSAVIAPRWPAAAACRRLPRFKPCCHQAGSLAEPAADHSQAPC